MKDFSLQFTLCNATCCQGFLGKKNLLIDIVFFLAKTPSPLSLPYTKCWLFVQLKANSTKLKKGFGQFE